MCVSDFFKSYFVCLLITKFPIEPKAVEQQNTGNSITIYVCTQAQTLQLIENWSGMDDDG